MDDSETSAAMDMVYDSLRKTHYSGERVPILNLLHEAKEGLLVLDIDDGLANKVLSQMVHDKIVVRRKKEYIFQ